VDEQEEVAGSGCGGSCWNCLGCLLAVVLAVFLLIGQLAMFWWFFGCLLHW